MDGVFYVSEYERIKIAAIANLYGLSIKNILYRGKKIKSSKKIENYKILKTKKQRRIKK